MKKITLKINDKEIEAEIRENRDYGSVLPPLASVEHWWSLEEDCEKDLKIVFGG